MKIVSIVGSGSGCGKTTVACAILRAFPGLGAIKISPRERPCRVEWGAGKAGKDTDLFVNNGAVRVARIIGKRVDAGRAWDSIKGEFNDLPGVVIEGSSGLDFSGEKLRVFVDGRQRREERSGRSKAFAKDSDVAVELKSHQYPNSLLETVISSHSYAIGQGSVQDHVTVRRFTGLSRRGGVGGGPPGARSAASTHGVVRRQDPGGGHVDFDVTVGSVSVVATNIAGARIDLFAVVRNFLCFTIVDQSK